MRRATAAAVAAVAIVAAGCGGGDDGASSDSKPRTLRLESQLTHRERVPIDAPGGADTVLRLQGQIFRPGDDGADGRLQETCVRAQRGDGEVYNCDIAFVLPKGVVYGQAVASKDGPPSGAVVGGSGDFAGVRGTFTYGAARGDRLVLTLSLR